MRRVFPVFALVIWMIGAALLPGEAPVRAQEATPAAEDMEMEGLSFLPIGVAPGVTLPEPADLMVARSEFQPGASFPFEASYPEGSLVIVESGELTVHVEEQAWFISRGNVFQQAMSADPMNPNMDGVLEDVVMGAEATLKAGDVAYIPGFLTGEVRNTTDAPASALLVVVAPSMMGAQATPTS